MKLPSRRRFLYNAAILVITLGLCTLLCYGLSFIFDDNNPFAVPIFVLGVAVVSRFSTGYFCGIAASLIGVVCVNYMFTYPFWEFDMSLTGYPLTFAVMFLVSILISTLTTQVKQQQRLMYEARSESMRANLLRAISHDIRTPLASIVGASSVLLEPEQPDAATQRELLQGIHRDAEWLIRVTENILSVTKFSGEDVRLNLTEEVAEEIVGSAIRKFRRIDRDIAITVHRPDDILLVPMEATLIEQVLINLLENAVLHAAGMTRLQLEVTLQDGKAHFCVSDDGCGIARSRMDRLFTGILDRDDELGDSKRSGMGIGLFVCAAIVRAHGGSILAGNLPEGGACFRFALDMEESNEQ